MPVEVRMPALGMTMEEGRVVSWLVREGDSVKEGQILVEIESEKAAYDVESPADGVVARILVAMDVTVPVGTPLVSIVVPGDAPAASAPVSATGPARAPVAPMVEQETAAAVSGSATAASAGPSPAGARPRLSPRARKLAEEVGVDLTRIAGTGPDGTIVEQDIRDAAIRQDTERARPAERSETPFTLRPLTSMRRAVAERMARSAREAPHFYLAVEIDGTALLRWRECNAARLQAETGIALTVTDLLLRLTARTLAEHPLLNASYTPEGIREWSEVNLGLAVAVDGGLIVPVIRGAERKSLAELMAARLAAVSRAHVRKLTADDFRGGTFTLSNLGGLGVDFFTSILNLGEGGILSVGRLAERPAVVDGRIVARPGMRVGLTIDHRVADGADGARFLADLRARAEAAELER